MLRNIGAALAGYATLAITTMLLFGVLAVVGGGAPPEGELPSTGYTLVVLVAGVLCALAGGWVCARLATPSAPWGAVVGLGALVVTLGVAMALNPTEPLLPAWYRFGLPVIGGVGVLLGGRVRLAPRTSVA